MSQIFRGINRMAAAGFRAKASAGVGTIDAGKARAVDWRRIP